MRKRGIKEEGIDRAFNIINLFLMLTIAFLMIYPLYFTVIASISDPYSVVQGKVSWKPLGFTLEAYQNAFRNENIWNGYRNTTFYTVFGTLFSLFVTIPTAYVMSKKTLPTRGFLMTLFIIPLYFSGGLIPTYLIVKRIGLLNKPYSMIILGGLNIYNMIVTRVYFQTSIPEALYESARIDGANDFRVFFKISLPLATPILAVMTLFYAVTRWNDYFTGLIYLLDTRYYTLQQWLRAILLQNQNAIAGTTGSGDAEAIAAAARLAYMAEAMKYALIFIASAPMLIAYPFVQKYFIKGIMIGSLKG